MSYPFVRTAFDRVRTVTDIGENVVTKQSFKDECDVNRIMSRYEKSGLVSHVNRYQGKYGDFAFGYDYHEVMNRITSAEEMFLTLPSKIRAKFGHDVGLFLDFVNDKENYQEMVDMGLIKPKTSGIVSAPPLEKGSSVGSSVPSEIIPETGSTPASQGSGAVKT